MKKITESDIEEFAIELLEVEGYEYVYGPDLITTDDQLSLPLGEIQERGVLLERGVSLERENYSQVILFERLRKAMRRINPEISYEYIEDAIKQIERLNSPELVINNKDFHKLLTEGIRVIFEKDGSRRGDYVWLIDFNNPENNDFMV